MEFFGREKKRRPRRPRKPSIRSRVVDHNKVYRALQVINDETLPINEWRRKVGGHLSSALFSGVAPEIVMRGRLKANATFAAICRNDQLKISPYELSNLVRVDAQDSFLGKNMVTFSKLSFAQKIKLLRVSDEYLKTCLAKKAVQKYWTLAELTAAINKKPKGFYQSKEDMIQAIFKDLRTVENKMKNLHNLKFDLNRNLKKKERAYLKKCTFADRETLYRTANKLRETFILYRKGCFRLMQYLDNVAEQRGESKRWNYDVHDGWVQEIENSI